MTLELIIASVSSGVALIGAIFGGNLLTRYINHAKELAVTKYVLEETKAKLEAVIHDVAELKSNSVEVNTKVEQFEEHIKKLEMIPEINARLSALDKVVGSVQSLVDAIRIERSHSK